MSPSKRPVADAVIDLTLDSDDEQDMGSNKNRNPNNSNSTPSSKRARTGNASQAMNGFEDDDDDDIMIIDKDEFDKKPAAKPSLKKPPPKPSEDGVQIVESSVACPTAAAAAAPSNNVEGDDELAVVGTRNEYKLPHLRQDCTTCKFTPNSSNRNDLRAENEKHCDLCYCYGEDVVLSLFARSRKQTRNLNCSYFTSLFQCVTLLLTTAK